MLSRHPVLAGILVSAWAWSPAGAQPVFIDPVLTVPGPSGAVVADFDADGHPDLAVTSFSDAGVTVFLGRGDGTVGPPRRFPTQPGGLFLTAADLNHDARPDLLIVGDPDDGSLSPRVSLLMGNGDGTFAPQVLISGGLFEREVAVADFNEDGDPDLAILDGCYEAGSGCPENGGGVSILPGRGDGTFGAEVRFRAGHEPLAIVTADFDADGHRDILVANSTPDSAGVQGPLSLLRGRGDGSFDPEARVGAPTAVARRAAVGDLDHDGQPDVVAVGGGSFARIFLNRGGGTFVESTLQTGGSTTGLAIGDFDRDGYADLAAAGRAPDRISVFPGNGDGTFGIRQVSLAGTGPSCLASGDLDGDDRTDLVVCRESAGALVLLAGNGDGTFGAPARQLESLSHWETALTDFNGDGRQDLIVSNGDAFYDLYGDLSVLAGRGDGTFGPEVHIAPGPVRAPLRAADFNLDGAADLVVGNWNTSEISLLLGHGDGGHAPERRFLVGFNPGQLAVGDLDGNGVPDLVSVNQGRSLPPRYPRNVSVLLGTGDGSFLPEVRLSAVPFPIMAAIADFNGDGRGDLAVSSEESLFDEIPGQVYIFLGRGDGHFDPGPVLDSGEGAFEVMARDFNADGKVDLAVNNRGSSRTGSPGGDVSIFLGTGQGDFAAARHVPTAGSPIYLDAADFDLDGRLDLLTGDATGDASVLMGRGDGTFAPAARFLIKEAPEDIAASDLNGDGAADIVAQVGTSIVVLLNRTSIDRDRDGLEDKDDNCPTAANPGQEDRDHDGVGDACDVCPAVSDPQQEDADRDGIGDACDACSDRDGDGAGDPGYPGNTCPTDNCPQTANPSQLDADGDGSGDACDDCPLTFDPAQADADHDGPGDACDACTDRDRDGFGDPGFPASLCAPDNCPAAANPAQEDADRDGLGDLCDACTDLDDDGVGDPGRPLDTCGVDNCPDTGNPDQADGNQDGSGDACQPAIVLAGVRQDGGETLEVDLRVSDPQGDPLSGRIEILALPSEIRIEDAGIDAACSSGFFPDGLPGRGIGYLSLSVGSPVLFDLDTALSCEDGQGDFILGLGQCDHAGFFSEILSLADRPAPFPVCMRESGAATGGLDLTVLELDEDEVRFAVEDPDPIILIPFGPGLPAAVDLSTLVPGTRYRLAVTLTDGTTVPVSAGTEFLYQAEARMVFPSTNRPPLAAIAAPALVECDGPAGSLVHLDGTGSTDPDSSGGAGIAAYLWVGDPGLPSEVALGADPTLSLVLPLGAHTIGLRVTDSEGAVGTAQTIILVRDSLPPTLTGTADPGVLWPPNHRLVPVRFAWTVADRCDPSVSVRLVSVAASEPDDAPGDGDGRTTGDIAGADLGTPDTEILLRAERSGEGAGRIYEITASARDASGNQASVLAAVRVPHDLGEGPEPVRVGVEPGPTPGTARVYWNEVAGALGYDVISGDVGSLKVDGDHVTLGAVRVLARLTTTSSWTEAAGSTGGGLAATPDRGKAFFYLVQYRDTRGASGYGTESAPLPNEPVSCAGGCPGEETAQSAGDSDRRIRR
jgi:hypothetical protein